MAEQANFHVTNEFTDGIFVYRELPGGGHDLDTTIAAGSTEMFPMPGTDLKLIVNTPDEKPTEQCYIDVVPENGLPVSCTPAASSWTLQIESNKSLPESPTTVNVTCGGDE